MTQLAAQAQAGGFNGNTADYAQSILSAAALGAYALKNYVAHDSKSYWYTDSLAFLFQSTWDQLVAEESGPYNASNLIMSIFNQFQPELGHSQYEEALNSLNAAWADAGYSPIVIDLNSDGIHLTDFRDKAVAFDINGDGLTDKTAWVADDDGFLARDENRNGVIDSVNELFGGKERGEGFGKLARLDDNGDGVVSASDRQFDALSLWQDKNHDGQTDPGELKPLAEAGIETLSLAYVSQELADHGNLVGETSAAMARDACARELMWMMADVYFRNAPGGQNPLFGSFSGMAPSGGDSDAGAGAIGGSASDLAQQWRLSGPGFETGSPAMSGLDTASLNRIADSLLRGNGALDFGAIANPGVFDPRGHFSG